ncbi:hypothetical protein HZB88_04570 [archaeon]|nr:hypothetical protein [archaeon]
MKFIERENEITGIVRKLTEFRVIIVGGYAVSARAMHRFSVDCDIVISKKDLERVDKILVKEGFKRFILKEDFDREYGGKFMRYIKKVGELPVNIDLLVDSLVCRTTNASWSFDYIFKNSDKTIISGIEDSVECLVPNKELLLAFKIHSARKADLRDIIMLANADWGIVKEHLNRGDLVVLKKQVDLMLKELDNKNLANSIKGTFQLKQDIEKMIKDTKKQLNSLL